MIPSNPSSRRGFSVIELIVSIGAIALITVGVAKIFQTVGETVTGGRRVSGFTQAAATLESQMRLDVESLTRDGFMVIHHQRTAASVALAPGASNPRKRRTDELMFFARGEFTTNRPMVSPDPRLDLPDRVATANEARIYYGHGTHDDLASEGRDRYLYPAPFDGDLNNPGLMGSHLGEVGGPNEYASDWSLLRLATLLVEPKSQPTISVPDGTGGAMLIQVPIEFLDSEYQIAYQPAMGSLFKAFAHRGGNDLTSADMPAVFYDFNADGNIDRVNNKARPTAASGIIDIATTSIEEVRAIVMDVGGTLSGTASASTDGHPRAVTRGADSRPLGDPTLVLDVNDDLSEVLLNRAFDPWTPSDKGDLPFMHAWMRDAMPAYSGNLPEDLNANLPTNERVRTEPLPPDLVETAFSATSAKGAYFFADQIALTGNELLPRCTEFIVEWSFGEVIQGGANAGQLIWHGGPDTNGFAPYEDGLPGTPPAQHSTIYTRSDASSAGHVVPRELIHDDESFDSSPNELYSYFGTIDPTYQPMAAEDPPTIPWAWPKLLRITATFADAVDPTIEESTQFVIEVPEQ